MASPSVQNAAVEVLTSGGMAMAGRAGPIVGVAPSSRRNTRSSLSKVTRMTSEDVLQPGTASPVALSVKALGKRRESSNVPLAPSPLNPDTFKIASSRKIKTKVEKDEAETKKRVMPVRQRRGGPGVGSSAVDVMIMESQRRSAENNFTLSPSAVFVLTTDSNFVATTSTSASRQRYFQKPEVVKECVKQEMIQTPDFERLTESSAVTRRLRAREGEQQITDDSDAAYERRHRKYETFEKRQRRREKEKLQHEQYKLKERIDELRSMDVSAFAVGGLSHQEAEEKKRSMLKEAEELDKRYAILLPSEKKGLMSKTRKPGSFGFGMDTGDGTGTESRASTETDLARAAPIRLRLKRGRISTPTTDDLLTSPLPAPDIDITHGAPNNAEDGVVDEDQSAQEIKVENNDVEPVGKKVNVPLLSSVSPRRNTSAEPAPKRRKLSASGGAPIGDTTDGDPPAIVPQILQFAQRSKPVAEPHAKRRVQPRHPLAFGVQMPPTVDTWKEFELPRYIVRDFEDRHIQVDEEDVGKILGRGVPEDSI